MFLSGGMGFTFFSPKKISPVRLVRKPPDEPEDRRFSNKAEEREHLSFLDVERRAHRFHDPNRFHDIFNRMFMIHYEQFWGKPSPNERGFPQRVLSLLSLMMFVFFGDLLTE